MDDVALVVMCGQLAAAVGAEQREGRSKKWRCPAELRSQVLVYAGHCRSRGEPLGDIAGRLGLVESTLARWLRRERSVSGFRPVAIVPHEPGRQLTRPIDSTALRLITPRGYAVEGLDLDALMSLLQVVG